MSLKRTTTPRDCIACGVSFFPRVDAVKVGRGYFCSRPCIHRVPVENTEFAPDGLTARIPLVSFGTTIRGYVLVDAADAEWVNQWRWHLNAHGYASRSTSGGGVLLLHRELLGLKRGDGIKGDHINRDKLDARRINLRTVTAAGNAQNRSSHPGSVSKYRGVYWSHQAGGWSAQVKVNGKSRHLGFFTSEEEAAEVAHSARLRVFPGAVD